MLRTYVRPVIVVAVFLAAAGPGVAAPTAKDKKLLANVSATLLAVSNKPAGFAWDQIDIGFMEEPGKDVGARSSFVLKDGKRIPTIRVGERLMAKIVWGEYGQDAGAADRLAFILGHELGHLAKDHFLKAIGDKAPPVVFTRDQEIEADLYGCQLLLKAGYDLKTALGGVVRIKDFLKDQGLNYSSFEGLGADHPSWDDRLAKADKDRAELWKAMAAFETGNIFLATADFITAIQCFDKVTKQFPACHEAWANLGYARLMSYCDDWGKRDLQDQGIGQVVSNGFLIRRPIRHRRDTNLWFNAVGALREADRLKPGQTVVLANLGLAYLLAPDGKDTGESTRFFAAAVAAAKNDTALDPVVHATLLINLGVNALAAGDPDQALKHLEAGETIVRSTAGTSKRAVPKFDAAIGFTRALLFAARPGKVDKEKAHALLEDYLRTASLAYRWWDRAYDVYTDVCKTIGKEPKAKAVFTKDRPEPTRPVTGVKLTINGKQQTITLGADSEDVEEILSKGQKSIAIQGTSLDRIRYETEGVELLAGESVIAIILTGPNAPAVPLVGKTTGIRKGGELKVGMSEAEVRELLGQGYDLLEIATVGIRYHFYPEQGLAVCVEKGKVVAVVIANVPA